MSSSENNYGKINLDFNNPTSTDRNILLEELLTIRIEILRSIARARVVWERIEKEKFDLFVNESADSNTENKRKEIVEEMEAATNAITSLKNRLVALDKTVGLIKGILGKELLEELLSIEK